MGLYDGLETGNDAAAGQPSPPGEASSAATAATPKAAASALVASAALAASKAKAKPKAKARMMPASLRAKRRNQPRGAKVASRATRLAPSLSLGGIKVVKKKAKEEL